MRFIVMFVTAVCVLFLFRELSSGVLKLLHKLLLTCYTKYAFFVKHSGQLIVLIR